LAPRKGLKRSKYEHIKATKAHPNPEKDTVVSEPERQLRKSTLAQRYTSSLKGKVAPKESTFVHFHKQLEFASPENHNSKEPQTPSTPASTSSSSPASTPVAPINIQIPIAQTMVVNRMDAIIVARYAPLVFPVGLHALPATDYMKYLPRYNGEGDVTAEEHLVAFYNFADNFNIDYADVWMRLFVQSLDGEVRKWFWGLPPASIVDIDVLDEAFIKKWGDRRDYLYYITEFGALKRKNGESILDFTKRFNKMYGRIPDEIKPTEASAKITYANAFDAKFSLLLRERRSTTLLSMQEATIEVESNILASDRLKTRSEKDKKKQREDSPASSNPTTSDPKLDEMTKTLKDLTSEIAKLKWESKQPNRAFQGAGNINPNQFRRSNDAPQIMQRERRNVDDQRVVPPFQNNQIEEMDVDSEVVDDVDVLFNETYFHTSHLTQQDYEVAQLSNQFDIEIGEEGVIQGQPQKKYDLRPRTGTPKATTSDQNSKTKVPPKSNPSKGALTKAHQPPPFKPVVPEVKEVDRPQAYFILENELRKIKILVPLSELLKNEPFKKSIMKVLQPPTSVVTSDVISLQDENPAITVGPHIEDGSDASPPFYISLNIHDKILHNCLMDSGASHNVMPKVVMEELGLEITNPYQDLYSFDSKKFKCLGLIKYLVVSLA
jgi:hypothetical protein